MLKSPFGSPLIDKRITTNNTEIKNGTIDFCILFLSGTEVQQYDNNIEAGTIVIEVSLENSAAVNDTNARANVTRFSLFKYKMK